ncbi:MAG TPA: pyrroline-5-carboxylate reductase [Limnobacter sp.]|nr:pyrroline-5-carboxylate reductase [Limnobacter sp.]
MKNMIFIGAGNMAYAILGGLIAKGASPSGFRAIDPSEQATQKMRELGIACTPQWPSAFQADVVVLAVKPQQMQTVLQANAAHLGKALLVSIAAGVGVEQLRLWSGQSNARVVRCMPNTPALVGQGMAGLYFTQNCSAEDQTLARQVFESCGEVIQVKREEDINAITAISGSGPGYVFFLMESLAQAACGLGFSPEQANLLVQQTFLGAATLAKQSSDSFATLREKVTSKGGTTFAGLEQLRAMGVHTAIEQAARAACERAEELQRGG